MERINHCYIGAKGKKSLYDLIIPKDWNGQLLFFLHGYKGYKDWGAWNMLQDFFTLKGYAFLKLNFSHNGGNTEQSIDFPDLHAFAENRYSYELKDAKLLIAEISKEINPSNIVVIGHSRGGGIASLLAAQNKEIDKLITLASVDDFENRFVKGDKLELWKETGIYYVKNGRTNQNMPHNYSFYRDYFENKAALNIQENLSSNRIDALHIHGKDDLAVNYQSSINLANWSKGELCLIENTGHTFDTRQPWLENKLSDKLKEAAEVILKFIK